MSLASLTNSAMTDQSKLLRLRDRAQMFGQARRFFEERSVWEVDCPILSAYASVDAHIDLIVALYQGHKKHYLHSSPEYGMKRLLAEGSGDIYQLSHMQIFFHTYTLREYSTHHSISQNNPHSLTIYIMFYYTLFFLPLQSSL